MEVRIILKKTELDYDIGMITHVIGNREIAAGSSHEQAYNYSNTDDGTGEVNLIARFEENAINELRAAFGRHLKEEANLSDNDLLEAFGGFEFELDMPENFNTVYTKPIRSKAHEFVVNRTLYDWFMEAKPDEAKKYMARFEDAIEDMKSYLNKRTGRSRIKPYPPI